MATVAESLNSTVTLNDGVVMPMFGLGTSRMQNIEEVVDFSIRHGYRMIDTATHYQTEEGVGLGIRRSGAKREDLFLVTKAFKHGAQVCQTHFKESLKKLGTSYIDLYLIHHPIGPKILETYDKMLQLKQQGLIISVGVANFNIHHLEALKAAGRPLPSVNQFELHPFMHKSELVEYCRKEGITIMGYSPLSKMQKPDDAFLNQLAAKYNRTMPQVMIRWSVQKGYITIPKSSTPNRITENAQVFDFELNQEEMTQIESNPEHRCTFFNTDPTECPWEG